MMTGRPIETREIITTNMSSTLNKLLQNAPLCMMKPYEISFKHISIVKTLVKK